MELVLFLNSLLEFYLSFGSEFLYNLNLHQISILVLSLFLFFFIFFVGIPSIPTFWKNEHIQKRQGRAKRRRKGGTRKGSRYYQSKKEERELISFLKSPLGQNYDTTRFRQFLCPDPSCEVCNNAAADINRLFLKALEDSTPSVSPVASTAPVIAPLTEPSLNQSSAFPGVPTGELISTPPPEPSPPPPSVLPLNSMTTVGDFLSPSPPGQTLPPEPVHHSSPQPKDLFSSTLTQYDFHQGFLALQSTKTSFGADPAAKFIDPKHLSCLSPDEHDSAQQHLYPKTWENHLKQKLTQLFWGLPSLHSESLSSAVHASGDYSIFFNSISNTFTGQESPGLPCFLPPSLPEVQPQTLPEVQPQTLPEVQPPPLPEVQPQTLPEVQPPPLPEVQPQPLPEVQPPPLPEVQPPPLPEVQPQTLPEVQPPPLPEVQPPPLPEVQPPPLPEVQPQPLPEVQPQPLPQTLPQYEQLHLTQLQPQAHLQSPLPILPSSPITQNKVCEVYFHRPKNESECLTSSANEHLECNVLQKEQESLWGLTSVVQNSKAHVAISIDPVEFPLSSEFREKFESHLRERLIQHHRGQPCRIHESLSLMRPLSNCSGIPESKSSSGLSWVSVNKDQGSENPNVGLSQTGSFYERSSERFQLEDKGKDERQSQQNDPKVHLLSDSKTSSDKDVGSGSDMSLSRENVMVSGHSVTQRQLENVQKVHVSIKFEKISDSQMPGTVHSAQHSINQISSIKSHTKLEQRNLPSSVGGDYHLDTSQELPLLGCGAPQMQKLHITKFQMRMLSGLPTKVLESKEHFKSKDTSNHSLIDSSTIKLISEANTKSGAFMPLRESSESPLGDKVGTENAADHLNFPLPATSLVSKKGHSPANIQRTLSEEIQKILKAKLPAANTISGKKSQIHSLIANIQPPKMPTRRAGSPQTTNNNSANCNDRAEIRQGANREKSEPAFISSLPREIVRAEGLSALQPKTSGFLTTSKPEVSQKTNRETTETTENLPFKLSVQALELSELKTQVMAELKLKLEKTYSQARGLPMDMSHDSDSLSYRASPTPATSVSSEDTGVPLQVHSEDSAVRVEKQQEPWLPKHKLMSCQDQNVPLAVKKDIMHPPPMPTGPKYEELGGGDAQVRISQPGGKRFPPQDTALEVMFGSKSPQTLSQEGQAQRDGLFLNKMKSFFKRLHPRINYKMQEIPQEKGSPMYSAQSRGPVKSTAAFTGTAQVHRVMSDIGKFPEEKRGHQHAGVTTCPQEPLPSAVQSGKPMQNGTVQAQTEPVQGHPFHRRTPSYEVTNAMSGRQAAILAGQGSTYNRHTRNEDRHAQNIVTLKDQQICQKHPQSVPLKGTVPHPSPTCRPQAVTGPPAVVTTAGGTAFRGQPPRFRHTMLLQNFQGETFPSAK